MTPFWLKANTHRVGTVHELQLPRDREKLTCPLRPSERHALRRVRRGYTNNSGLQDVQNKLTGKTSGPRPACIRAPTEVYFQAACFTRVKAFSLQLEGTPG